MTDTGAGPIVEVLDLNVEVLDLNIKVSDIIIEVLDFLVEVAKHGVLVEKGLNLMKNGEKGQIWLFLVSDTSRNLI